MRTFDIPSETTASAVGGQSSVHGLAKVVKRCATTPALDRRQRCESLNTTTTS